MTDPMGFADRNLLAQTKNQGLLQGPPIDPPVVPRPTPDIVTRIEMALEGCGFKDHPEDANEWVKDCAELLALTKKYQEHIENYVWNLAGICTISEGWCKPYDYSKEMAGPALNEVSKLRKQYDELKVQLDNGAKVYIGKEWREHIKTNKCHAMTVFSNVSPGMNMEEVHIISIPKP